MASHQANGVCWALHQARVGSSWEHQLLSALVLKSRDRDQPNALVALQMLTYFPADTLLHRLQPHDWASIIAQGFLMTSDGEQQGTCCCCLPHCT